MRLKPLMFVGTGSDVGKSVITAGFCRILKQDGFSPAPFKAQNMSLNSFATPDGLEIGRAQAVQAEAAGIPCNTNMNPILLKPTGDMESQVVLNGKPIGNQHAQEYFNGKYHNQLFKEVCNAFDLLSKDYNPIVMEGAGSISEVNLWDRDIVNMRMAKYANASTILVADIDRGGVIGSVYGSILLLPPEERKLISGILINKFRGDLNLFEGGKKIIESLTGIPVLGVLPYYHDIHIDQEDAVPLDKKNKKAQEGKINIAVVLLKRMSNFTDFNLLEQIKEINIYYATAPKDLEAADIIILPGSKNTIEDLTDLRKRDFEPTLLKANKDGKSIIGICGGFQMMGAIIEDPDQIESTNKYIKGLNLLPLRTIITKEKRTIDTKFFFRNQKTICHGYEIHMGITEIQSGQVSSALCILEDGTKDGYYSSSRCWGTYLHGILDNPPVIRELIAPFSTKDIIIPDILEFKDQQYNKLANHIRCYVNVDKIYKSLQE